MMQIEVSILSPYVEVRDGDSDHLKMIKYCIQYKKTTDDEIRTKIVALRNTVLKNNMNPIQILKHAIETNHVFTDDSVALHMNEKQYQALKEKKLSILFIDMIEKALKHEKAEGDRYGVRLVDILAINDAKLQLKLTPNPTTACKLCFEAIYKSFCDGFITKVDPSLLPVQPVVEQPKVEEQIAPVPIAAEKTQPNPLLEQLINQKDLENSELSAKLQQLQEQLQSQQSVADQRTQALNDELSDLKRKNATLQLKLESQNEALENETNLVCELEAKIKQMNAQILDLEAKVVVPEVQEVVQE
ncbi:Hypothetical_protein [Hexamita inflata]|uniref:Hypothetical_protein n=1 Tax=Hexamita inflata TaxID=28002 RepID=A0AA86N889_9EUKA|nr:Hypothetical protein HINF_LOCUS2454 [Hexamita inflata]